MGLEFTGERITPDLLELNLGSFLRLAREVGPLTLLYLRAEHLSRYSFLVQEKLVAGKRVLDIGCGVGYGADILREGQPRSSVGVDIDFPCLEHGRKTYGQRDLNFVNTNAEGLPFTSDSFDVVISFEMIEHLKNPEAFLIEVSRVITNEGIFLVSTPNREVTNPGKTLEDKPDHDPHEREYNREEFRQLLEKYFNSVELWGQSNPIAHSDENKWLKRARLFRNLVKLFEFTQVSPFSGAQEPINITAVCRGKKK